MPKNKFSNFDNTFKEVAEASAKKANVYTLINISTADLIDYPKNQEDTGDTADIENSISEVGFIDPIEVTGYGQPDGKFMIISGHRRRAAGVKCGIDYFPCITRNFDSDEEVYNYVLLSNNHRDSSKDPLLYCRRYKMHEEYLNQINFTGNYRTEISKRLGISKAQADRYNAMNRIIVPVWDMVRDEAVSISGVFPLASHSPEEQEEIVVMMNECLDSGEGLSREIIKMIVEAYRDGKRRYKEINSGVAVNLIDRNDEAPGDEQIDLLSEENKKETIKAEDKNSKKTGKKIITYLENINTYFQGSSFKGDKEDIELIINSLAGTFEIAINGMDGVSKENNLDDVYDKFLENMMKRISEKIKNR